MSLQALTHREKQVVLLKKSGKTNAEIGEALGIATGTVKMHNTHIRYKNPEILPYEKSKLNRPSVDGIELAKLILNADSLEDLLAAVRVKIDMRRGDGLSDREWAMDLLSREQDFKPKVGKKW